MPYKDPERRKQYSREHYQANKVYYARRSRDGRMRLKQLVKEIKTTPCADCKQTFPFYMMEFDHRPGEEKVSTVSALMRHGTREQVMNEIRKCDIVCANCHRQRSWDRSH